MKHACDVNVCYTQKASRLKLFTRALWMFVIMWIVMVWGFAYGFVYFLHWWYTLILGRRHEGFFRFQLKFFQYMTRLQAWQNLLTDERPKYTDEYSPYCKCEECGENTGSGQVCNVCGKNPCECKKM